MANKYQLPRGTKARLESIKNTLANFTIVYATDTNEIGIKKANGNIEYFMNATAINEVIGDIESALDAILGV